MNKQQKEILQASLNSEKEVLKKLTENYQDAIEEIDNRIAILQGRQDADLQHVIYQLDYQKALKTQIQTILEQLQNNNFESISEYLTQSYEDGFLGTMYDLQAQGIPLVFPIDQEQVVAAIQHETKLSESLYSALGKDTKVLSKQIAGEISRGISNAAMYSEMSRNIASYCGISKNKAMRIARTEAHRIQNKAISNAQWKAKEKGADIVKIWSAALDGKTRDHHRELDGQIRELDEPFEVAGMEAMEPGGFGVASEDCNCRCRCNSKARWLVDKPFTKWSEDAPVLIDDDGTTQLLQFDNMKNYADFKDKYWKAIDDGSVRSSVQMMKSLEKSGKGSTIKAITVEDLNKANTNGEIKQEVINSISKSLDELDGWKLFEKVNVVSIPSNGEETVIFQTVPIKTGTWVDFSFDINKDAIGGKTVEEIDEIFKKAQNTACNSMKDAISHEKYHSQLYSGKTFAEMEALDEELNEIHIESFTKTAYKNGGECISEVGAMIDRGDRDMVPSDALELFNKYIQE